MIESQLLWPGAHRENGHIPGVVSGRQGCGIHGLGCKNHTHAAHLGLPRFWKSLDSLADLAGAAPGVYLVEPPRVAGLPVTPGQETPEGGLAAGLALETALEALTVHPDWGLVTAPLSKRALNAAGFAFPGHTEFLAERSGVGRSGVCMHRVTARTVCVETIDSKSYNRIVEEGDQTPQDWVQTDKMLRPDGLYRYGLLVNNNAPDTEPGAGSCIFFHIWRRPGAPTAGCTAMPGKVLTSSSISPDGP